MNKNKFLKIAKSVYFQNKIAKQLFAAMFNPQKQFTNKELADFSGKISTVGKLFEVFIGSSLTTTGIIQFIKKNGNTYSVYPLTSTGIANQKLNPIKQFNSLQKLKVFLQSNNARTSYTKSSLSQILRNLYDCICFNGDIKNKCIVQLNKPYKDLEGQDDMVKLQAYLYNSSEIWKKQLNDYIQQIYGIKDFGMLPLVFEQTQQDALSEEINNLSTIIQQSFNNYLDVNKHKVDLINKTIEQNVLEILQKCSNWIQQKADIKFLKEIASTSSKQFQNKNSNLSDTIYKYGNVSQHIATLYDIVYALKNSDDVSEEFQNQQLLDAIYNSNTKEQLVYNCKSGSSFNTKSVVNDIYDQRGVNIKSGDRKSALNTFVNFISGFANSKTLNGQTWSVVKQQLQYDYSQNNSAKQSIQKFDDVINMILGSDFKNMIYYYNLLNDSVSYLYNCSASLRKISKKQLNDQQYNKIIQFCNNIDSFIDAINNDKLFEQYQKPSVSQLDQIKSYQSFSTAVKNAFNGNFSTRYQNLKSLIQFSDLMVQNLNDIVGSNAIFTKQFVLLIFDNLKGTKYNQKSLQIPRIAFNGTGLIQQIFKLLYPND